MAAQVIAAGCAAGFYGKTDAIENLAAAMGVPYPGASGAREPVLRDLLPGLNRIGGAGARSHSRRASG